MWSEQESIILTNIRSVAIIGVVVSHVLHGLSCHTYAQFLGVSFVYVFLFLSALLLGGGGKNPEFFLKKRFIRLYRTYLPFLIFASIFIALFSFVDAIKFFFQNIIFGGYLWRDSQYGFGHLWYMTIICLAYISVYFINNFYKERQHVAILLIVFLVIIYIMRVFYPFLRGVFIVLLYDIIFINADILKEYILHYNRVNFFFSFLLLLGAIFCFGSSFDMSANTCDTLYSISAISIMNLLSVFSTKISLMEWVASLSFEIYLVHHPFFFGKYQIISPFYTPLENFIGIMIGLLLTLLLSSFLRKVSRLFNFYIY